VNSLHSLLGPPSSDTFLASIHISKADTYKILKEINVSKSCGPGNIPGRLLCEGAAHLAGPLSQLFNLSIQTYCISVTSIVVKLLERLIYIKTSSLLSENNSLTSSQRGLRSKHSCQTQLLQVVKDWSSTINRNSRTHAIFLDFSKAFDSVSHKRLLLKLEHIGIRGCLLNWICSFLIGREQCVIKIDNCSSD